MHSRLLAETDSHFMAQEVKTERRKQTIITKTKKSDETEQNNYFTP